MTRLLLVGALVLAACGGQGDAERRADLAYVQGRPDLALTTYSSLAEGGDDAVVWAKLAAAAARAGALDSAVGSWTRVAAYDSTRRTEAADAVEAIARHAVSAGDLDALHRAVRALGTLAPGRPVGRYVLPLVRADRLGPDEFVRLMPAALVVAPDDSTAARLLFDFAQLLAGRGACAEAAPAYASVTRRGGGGGLADSANAGYARCALSLGEEAGSPVEADRWLARAALAAPGSATSRRALLLLGDARRAQGDDIAAAIAWQRAIDGGNRNDSIGEAAAARLRSLVPRDTMPADSAGPRTEGE